MTIANDNQSRSSELTANPLKVFFDGAGCRPGGDGSGFAWFCPDTGLRRVERVSGLTNNQAEYKAFLAALQNVPDGSTVEMFSDSQLICFQFAGTYRVKDCALQGLLSEIQALILTKRLKVKLQWVPRSQNLAGKLL
jgi:ribonuclease HI